MNYEQALKDIRPFDESMLAAKRRATELSKNIATTARTVRLIIRNSYRKCIKTAQIVGNVQGFKEVANFLTKKVERLAKARLHDCIIRCI